MAKSKLTKRKTDTQRLEDWIGFLLKRSDEAFSRVEAMRILLQKGDIFSEKQFLELYDEICAKRKGQTAQLVKQTLSSARAEDLHQLLLTLPIKTRH